MSERVKLNVGGIKYETCISTLRQFPETLLGTMFDPRNEHILRRDESGEVFIDRNGKIFSIILDFYRTAGHLNPFTNNPKYSQSSILSEVDFFQLPCSPPVVEIEEDAFFGEGMRKKAIERARAGMDEHLYTLLIRQTKQALSNAAGNGLNAVTIKYSHLGQTFFGQDAVGTPIYMITNVGAKDIFTTEHKKQLLLYDLGKMGLKVTTPQTEQGMITDTIWSLLKKDYPLIVGEN